MIVNNFYSTTKFKIDQQLKTPEKVFQSYKIHTWFQHVQISLNRVRLTLWYLAELTTILMLNDNHFMKKI